MLQMIQAVSSKWHVWALHGQWESRPALSAVAVTPANVSSRCQLQDCGVHGICNETTGHCDCVEPFTGARCTLAPAYQLDGGSEQFAKPYRGIYVRSDAYCAGVPVYVLTLALGGGGAAASAGALLFKPENASATGWMVASAATQLEIALPLGF